MNHNQIQQDADSHWAVSLNWDNTHVLIQLGDRYSEVRLALTPDEARRVIEALQASETEVSSTN